MKTILNRLINHEILSKAEAKEVLVNISAGNYNASQIASFLTVYMMRSITIEELSGFREALLELCIPVDFSAYNTIDLCGTGGDGKDTFNISTLASFIVAGAGIKVAKHGNYGVSSISGSSNVMEKMGVKFTNDIAFLTQSIEETNIAILHAPLFHPAMKNVGPIRKELGVKTFFNMLGPMVNPSFPKNQMVGVFSLELARMYAYLYQNTTTNYSILHGLSGFDEVSLTDEVKIITNTSENIVKPKDFQLPTIELEKIKGGNTTDEAAQIFYDVISGKGSEEQNNVVCVNAAIAIQTVNKNSFADAFSQAQESLDSGKAFEKLKRLIEISK
ncbi:MAG: anthranilate phosphoribosyltransferase [Flavobacterium sp.]|uniref:anthranilate phosphoribosyltransferase n=1 Tax=unclassified Flavobacterium TaxID=196869 RepID=UPI000C351A9A|nr:MULTISPECIES: anthranilate phosphoribosyltransferase [unclassified Flavobacterium]MBF03635.1 anthranilate phosphoribosyltransferase [Flavobacterium sp.]MCO6163125.1 anthranilate phosphoribosyltransferase [Flavobacterium sp. NRK F7]